jgi:hypothetical protein
MAAPSDSISLSGPQARPLCHLVISSACFSERRSVIERLTGNYSDVPFAFSDAPTLIPISKIVSAPDADSNEYKLVSNQPSGPHIYPSTFRERPDLPQGPSNSRDPSRPSSGFFDLHRPLNSRDFFDFVFSDIPRASTNFPNLLRASSTFCNLQIRQIQLISSPAFFDPARTSPTFAEFIRTDSTFLKLLRLSNSRDSGDL